MPKTAPFRTRFAPSPTGRPHLGNARAALFSWLAAKKNGGEMLLRIEDTGASPGGNIAAEIEEILAWLGLTRAGEARRQSDSAARHRRELDSLFAAEHAYYCFCTPEMLRAEREEMLRAGKPPRYSGKCAALSKTDAEKRVAAGEPAAVRFRMPPEDVVFNDAVRGEMRFCGADIGDFVLRRADGGFSFFFANALDDAADNISLVLRGEDHLSNTPRQLAILAALGKPAPVYGHLPLLTAPGGAPFSKREGAESLHDMRAAGFLPDAVNNYLARAGCAIHNENILTLSELAEIFSPELMSKSPSAFDAAALLHWQKKAAQNLSAAAHEKWLSGAFLDLPAPRSFAAFCLAARGNIVLYEDARAWAKILADDFPPVSAAAAATIQNAGGGFYAKAAAAVPEDMEWKPFCEKVKTATGCKGKNLFMPLRAALTGRTDGPEMPPLFKLIGAEKARRRLEAAG